MKVRASQCPHRTKGLKTWDGFKLRGQAGDASSHLGTAWKRVRRGRGQSPPELSLAQVHSTPARERIGLPSFRASQSSSGPPQGWGAA